MNNMLKKCFQTYRIDLNLQWKQTKLIYWHNIFKYYNDFWYDPALGEYPGNDVLHSYFINLIKFIYFLSI